MKKIFVIIFVGFLIFSANVEAESQKFFIDGDHGKLSVILQTPNNQKKFPLVILCHGFNADKNYPVLKIISEDLESRGIASIRFDFNAHGESEGEFKDMTIPNEIEDAKKIYDYAKKISGVTSISIAGHSQGGVVASMLAGKLGANKIKSVALLASASILREDTLRGRLFSYKFNPFDPPEYFDLDTHGYGIKRIGKNFITTTQNLQIFETSKKFQGAVLIVNGLKDNLVPYTCSLHYHEIYKNSTLKLLNDFDHAFNPNQAEVSKIVTDYFVKQLK